MQSDTKVLAGLHQAILDYSEGVEDRYGGTKLSTVLSILKAGSWASKVSVADLIVDILRPLQGEVEVNHDLMLALTRTVTELGIKDARVAQAAEDLVLVQRRASPKALAQILEIFAATGGDITPKLLESIPEIKQSEPRQWAHIAITKTYLGDATALAVELSDLAERKSSDWQVEDILDFLDDIFQLYSLEGLHLVLQTYADCVPQDDVRERVYSAYESLTGRNIRKTVRQEQDNPHAPKKANPLPARKTDNVIRLDDRDFDFLKATPRKAEPLTSRPVERRQKERA